MLLERQVDRFAAEEGAEEGHGGDRIGGRVRVGEGVEELVERGRPVGIGRSAMPDMARRTARSISSPPRRILPIADGAAHRKCRGLELGVAGRFARRQHGAVVEEVMQPGVVFLQHVAIEVALRRRTAP